MAAIAAYLGRLDDAGERVRGMLAAAPHRGSATAYVTIGCASLAVAWDSALADAFIGRSGDLGVALVGSIDNLAELEEQLSDDRVSGTGGAAGDVVDLIATAYRVAGPDFPKRMRGMFAGIVTDGTTAYCFRDHLGYQPLFYRPDGHGFWAASEPKQVIAGARIAREPDLDVVRSIFYRTLDDDAPAALRGVERLPKMTGLIVDAGAVRRHRYWFPERLLETASFSAAEVQDRFDGLMTTAVRRSLRGNDLLFLSGGIDSSAIAAYAAPLQEQLYGRPLTALSFVYPHHKSVDESRYVKLLADHYGMSLHLYEQGANATDGLRTWTALTDTPYRSAALAQTEEAYRRVRELGSRRILSGAHAEFVTTIQWFTLDHYLSHGRIGSAWRVFMAHRARNRSWVDIMRRAGRAAASGRLIAATDRIRRKGSPLVPAWVDLRMATHETPVPVRERWRRSQLAAFVGPGTSLEADEICQAACGVTVHKPWTDIDLWEFFLSLPAETKFPELQTKSLVRTLLRNRVPDVILDRTDKTVFDEAHMDRVDYALFAELLGNPRYRLPGVDYEALGHLIAERKLTLVDYQWGRDLANIHAFLEGSSREETRLVSGPRPLSP